jgi:hypothetical protein
MDQPEERGLPREIQNLLILVYADQTNRSFVGGEETYTASLDDLPNELELRELSLPDLKDWEEAVSRVADIFGHAISKLLNASNLATLAAKVNESLMEYRPDCDVLPDRLQLVLRNLGAPEEEAAQAARVLTAKAVRALLSSCDGKEPTKLVGSIAQAKLETNSTVMGRSLKSATDVLDCLRTTRWDLFTAVAGIEGERVGDATQLIRDVVTWLKTDEHALAGGLAPKLSEAEGRAIKLLTPPKTATPKPTRPEPPQPEPGRKPWSPVGSGREERLSSQDWSTTAEQLHRQLEDNPRYRISIEWTIEEEPQ